MSSNLKSNFQYGSAVYTCALCGKKTRDTGRGEVDGFCWSCTEKMMIENEHNDGGHDGNWNENCHLCQDEGKEGNR